MKKVITTIVGLVLFASVLSIQAETKLITKAVMVPKGGCLPTAAQVAQGIKGSEVLVFTFQKHKDNPSYYRARKHAVCVFPVGSKWWVYDTMTNDKGGGSFCLQLPTSCRDPLMLAGMVSKGLLVQDAYFVK